MIIELIKKIKGRIFLFGYYLFSFSNKKSFWFSTYNGRLLSSFISKIVNYRSPSYKLKINNFNSNNIIEKKIGFIKKIKVDYDLNSIINNCNLIRDNYLNNKKPITPSKSYLSEIDIGNYNLEMKEFIKFSLDKNVIKMITNYFNEIPIIHEIRLLYSHNKNFDGGSQYFHFDKEDNLSFKLFVNVNDNDRIIPNQCFIDATSSTQILKKYGRNKIYHRFSDDFIHSNIYENKLNYIYGKSGDIWGLDVCRFLHYGSRPSNTPRLLLWILYLPKSHYKFPFNLQGYTKMNLLKYVDWNLSNLDKYVLTGNK